MSHNKQRQDNGRQQPPTREAQAVLTADAWTPARENAWLRCHPNDLFNLPYIRRVRMLK